MTSLAERAAQMSPKAREVLARELVRAGTTFPTDVAEPVAVVGIGCRLPGSVTGPDSFWQLLMDGRDAVDVVPADRWDADAFYDPDPQTPGRMTTKWGGFVDDVAGFDADFFGITPREAEAMDPQQRILLEVAWEALEHAGLPPDSLSGTRTAAIMGLSAWDYTIVNLERRAEIDAYMSTGNPHSAAVGRISYLLGLRGPAVAVDTACSSSLVALHLACQNLRLRESDVALAGGVQLMLSPFTSIALSKWSALSPTGRCKTFDALADGFVRSEGCGVVVLKRLADATRDGDRVLAVIRGSAINQDGRSNGMTAPNAAAQRDVISTALRLADSTADRVNYIETHGTGTILGDPIEFEALSATYGRGDGKCALGSVKTNIGHLEAAAGITGFIKATLAVSRGQIPPNLHFTRWNPAIDPSSTRLFVPTEATAWPDGVRRAAVSSFGLSGTNAHVVIEQAPESIPANGSGPRLSTLVLSGKTSQRTASLAAGLADWMEGPGAAAPLADVAHTLNHHRSRHPKAAVVVARDHTDAIAGLRALAAGRPVPGVLECRDGFTGPGTVFVYSGQGSQWVGMGRRLLADEPAFAAAIDELEPDFVAQAGFSLRQTLADGVEVVGIDRIQPVLVGIQLALTALWRSYGVTPDAVVGHSMGEVSAAVVAGALTPADGLRVIATRSRLMAQLSGQGAMALLELDADAAAELIADYPQVTLAVHASPRQSVIAGPPESVDAVIEAVAAQNRLARRIDVDVASHHPIIDPVLPQLRSALADLAPQPMTIPMISTTSEQPQTVLDAEYWAANLRNPVRFHQAITTAAARYHTFIEVSPHPVLTYAIDDTLSDSENRAQLTAVGTLQRDTDDTVTFHTQLAAVGKLPEIDTTRRLADIPVTPWQHTPFWVADRSASYPGPDSVDAHPLLGMHVEVPSSQDHVWQADVGTDVSPWLADHKVFGQAVMPAAGFAEIALAAASEAFGLPVDALAINQLEVEQMLTLDGHTQVTTQLTRGADDKTRIEIYSRTPAGWCRHATARAAVSPPDGTLERRTPGPRDGQTAVSPADLYAVLRMTGQNHGPAFAALTQINRQPDGSVETQITLPEGAPRHPGYRIHPVMLDAALQGLAAAIPDEEAAATAGSAEISYLPVSFELLRVYGNPGRHAHCRARLMNLDEGGAGKLGKLTLTDDAGNVTAEINDLYLRRVERRSAPLPLAQKVFDTSWVEAPIAAAGPSDAPGSWLVLTDAGSKAEKFVEQWRSPARRVITADLGDEAAMLTAFAETAGDPERPPVGVVAFIGDGSDDAGITAAGLNRARDSVWAISTVVRAILGGWHGRSPRLWLVTPGGLAVRDEPGRPAIGALRGLVRVLAYEHPDLHTTLVDLDTTRDPVSALIAELESQHSAANFDDVVAWRDGQRYVERLGRATLGEPVRDAVVESGASYIVTGGLGGLGLVFARWLVESGAGRVVLNGRSEPSDDARKVLAELESRAEVAVVCGDIAAAGVAERLVAAAEDQNRRLAGIVHGAAVIDDSLVLSMSKESLQRVWAPKAAGALRMHQASVGRELDWWVGFSTTASLLGSAGQGAYACASAWLDALVAWRHAAGMPAAVINWGPWSEVGVAQSLVGSPLDPISPAEGIAAMDALLATDRSHTGVTRLRADRAMLAFPEIRNLGYFTSVVSELDIAGDGGDWSGPQALRELDPAEAREVVRERLCGRIAGVMGYSDRSAVDTGVPLTELGMDSLMAVRIRNTTRADFGIEPPVAMILQGASLQDLTVEVIRQLGLAEPEQNLDRGNAVRDRAQQRAAARQGAAMRRKRGQ
ncbi:type I polyketide synthase [Mycobacterium montefiorense]|uniref:Phthiocerol/phenolphthiocerol synthesis polyketide synthase type I PpsD n=1 Tax=Mycobacterium montefiorense TaxID=154654 RepID=A0AA37UUV4_9MYCO|nr:type I polyketide synthase [Mycobacterium montefiorense]GBG36379.1 Phthiocerol/phenolphthiocerol synthesis polyketide synthase type I PpsD [Mycobacterium montefiorense]GKU37118.1 phthiocerol/phenolphthiocerol synthesis polyketide synthase type I PpsD [Mycobacterium montefiorense]GKU43366.1 phthiocerol/phenolphthiocerol synthesis polyketide synthase type I PpsD [Mycobacterium montefiorense]GKU43898.1 phthiocerol/phenolphthiocerol synthesis polyketide synthase type I PpsD [Mycobacterium montef